MRSSFVKILLLLTIAAFVVMDAGAQRRRRTTRTDSTTTPTNQPTQQVQQNNNTAPAYNQNVPIEMAQKAPGSIMDTPRVSRRIDNAVDKGVTRDRIPLPYEHLRWDDALYTERVWREIDLREKINLPFNFKAQADGGDQRFISILLKAVMDGPDRGGVTAWDASVDDRFTTPLDSAAVRGLMAGGKPDTTGVIDPVTGMTTKYVVTTKEFNPDDVRKIRIKEDWVFDRESSRMFVRILGIAPLKAIIREDGSEVGTGTPMFWVYYPDMRPILAKTEVYNPKNMGMGRMTWEELFESRMFGSYIVKSTLDNPLDKQIKDYIKDPILRLLEGENIKERIFNYEQDLWSY
jgi:gliding motility associated protien GldN